MSRESNAENELVAIEKYVRKKTGYDIRTKNRTRETGFMLALYSFYFIADAHSCASHTDIGKFVGRHRTSVYAALDSNRDYVFREMSELIHGFVPFSEDVFYFENPFLESYERAQKKMSKLMKKLRKDEAYLEGAKKKAEAYRLTSQQNDEMQHLAKLLRELTPEGIKELVKRAEPIIGHIKAREGTENLNKE